MTNHQHYKVPDLFTFFITAKSTFQDVYQIYRYRYITGIIIKTIKWKQTCFHTNLLCGRYAQYVQVVKGTPIDIISFRFSLWSFLHGDSSCYACQLYDSSAVYIIPYPQWKYDDSYSLLSSIHQKQAWISLMINALETNFFYYQSSILLSIVSHQQNWILILLLK